MHFQMSSAICFNLDHSKILSSGNGIVQFVKKKNCLDIDLAKRRTLKTQDLTVNSALQCSLILTHYQTTNFRLVQIGTVCRPQS